MIEDDSLRVLELWRWNEVVARKARTRAGRAAVAAAAPERELGAARARIAETREALELLRAERLPRLRVEEDGLQLLDAARGRGSPLFAHEIAVLFRFLKDARDLRLSLLLLAEASALRAIGAAMPDLGGFVRDLERAIDERGLLLDSASDRLWNLRREILELKEQVRRELERMAQKPEIRPLLRSVHPSIRDGRYVLAVRQTARGQIGGLYHDRSATGATAYVEPEAVVEAQNRLRDLGIDEQREVVRILWELTRAALDAEPRLREACAGVARFDAACARAAIAADLGLAEPEVAAAGPLEVAEARHPLLLSLAFERAEGEPPARRAAARAAVVPFSLSLGAAFDVLVLTGPNTGGKTAALKAVGLLAVLPLTGCFVPASALRVPLFPGVYADIGDEQDLAQSLSTFSSHVTRVAAILRAARPGALVLLDELGSGTDPLEGESLALALLDHLLEQRLLAVVTTHLGRLKEFAGRRERAMNASVQFDPDTLRPTYRLILGVPGASNALRIARNLGLPPALLERAAGHLAETGDRTAALFDELDRARAAVEKMRAQAEVDGRVAADSKRRSEERERSVRAAEAALLQQAEHAAEARLRQLAADLEEPRRQLLAQGGKAAAVAGRMFEAMRKALAAAPLAEQRKRFAAGLKSGDRVLLPRYNEICRVRKVHLRDGRVEVDYRSLSVSVGFDEIAPAEAGPLPGAGPPR